MTEVIDVAPPAIFHTCGNDFISDTAQKIAKLTKTQTLKRAGELYEASGRNYFELGGLLWNIKEHQWFEGYTSFEAFASERFGFQKSHAYDMVNVYTRLVQQQIPFDKVEKIGWSKAKVISSVLTSENVDSWIPQAETSTVKQLVEMVKESKPKKTTNKATTPAEAQKLATATTEMAEPATPPANPAHTSDIPVHTKPSSEDEAAIKSLMFKIGWEATLVAFGDTFPKIDLTIDAIKA